MYIEEPVSTRLDGHACFPHDKFPVKNKKNRTFRKPGTKISTSRYGKKSLWDPTSR
jgi:hypothetical protein